MKPVKGMQCKYLYVPLAKSLCDRFGFRVCLVVSKKKNELTGKKLLLEAERGST